MTHLIVKDLRIPVETDTVDEYLKAAVAVLKINRQHIRFIAIINKDLDSRDQEQFYYDVSIAVEITVPYENSGSCPEYSARIQTIPRSSTSTTRPIIVGFGPAGIFAALELLERGFKPLIFERGKPIDDRDRDVQRFITDRVLDPESNIQFGEGGAGSYSDGKLFSRAANSPYITKVLDTFIRFGGPAQIGYDSKPHVGTDVLCTIVVAIRKHILAQGGEIFFNSKMTDLLIADGTAIGIVINGEKEYRSSLIYLAVGHSSRETFEMMHSRGCALEQKPISVGLRIEHPVKIIDLIRYGHKYRDFAGLGAARYSFTHTDKISKRGVYTFCMCPGGEVVNASSQQGLLVVNGMSFAARSSAFSNAALVVTCRTSDYGSDDPLAGIEFQKNIERKAFAASGGKWEVPAQNLPDFVSGKISARLNDNTCRTGTVSADLNGVFPNFVTRELRAAFAHWQAGYPLFVSEHAILLAAETRTTCPVRTTRGGNYASINVKNLYPIGEGSGYTGGITSSAADAIKAIEVSLGQGYDHSTANA